MTAPLRLADGSASAPGLAFASNPGTGLFKTAAGVGVAIGGVKVGELSFLLPVGLGPVPWSGSAAPAGWVLCYGQTLSRTAYPDLWTFAQAEIAAGNTLYNNGNGTTTFGIADLRGRVVAGDDNMGGTAAGRLTTAGGGVDGATLGAVGGTQTQTLALGQLPTGITSVNGAQGITVNFGGNVPMSGGGWFPLNVPNTGGFAGIYGPSGVSYASGATTSNSIAVTSNNTSGSAHPNVQPTIVSNFILFAGA